MFEYIDVHSHLYFPDFDKDREEEVSKIEKAKIAAITVGIDDESSKKAITLSSKHGNLFATVGRHPGDLTLTDEFYDISGIAEMAKESKVVAIGECGLDYYRIDEGDIKLKNLQKKVFQSQIDLALKLDKPLMLHIRPRKGTMDAYQESLDILESQAKISGDKLRGNAHFFVGDLDTLKRFLDLGFSASFGGVLTFTSDYDQSVRFIPTDMLMSETDAPFVAPEPYRGRRNSPLYIPEVVKRIALIREEPLEEVKNTLYNNAVRVFGLQLP